MKSIFISSEFNSDPEHIDILKKIVKECGCEPVSDESELRDLRPKAIDSFEDMKSYMEEVKNRIISSDYFLVDGNGLASNIGIESGAAWVLGKRIILANPGDENTSEALLGIADEAIAYSDYLDLKEKLAAYFKNV